MALDHPDIKNHGYRQTATKLKTLFTHPNQDEKANELDQTDKTVLFRVLQRPIYGPLILAAFQILVHDMADFYPDMEKPLMKWQYPCIEYEFDCGGRVMFQPQKRIVYEFAETKLSCPTKRTPLSRGFN